MRSRRLWGFVSHQCRSHETKLSGLSSEKDKRLIDVHTHVLPRRYMAFLAKQGISRPQRLPPPSDAPPGNRMTPWSDSAEDVDMRINLMDHAGVRQHILSPTFAPYLEDKAAAATAARLVNREIAALVVKKPDRFRSFASLPLPHIDEALAEIDYAFDVFGMDGATIQCFVGNRSATDPLFEPVYAELNRRGAVLFLHPCVNGLCSKFVNDPSLELSLGPPLEDTVIAVHYMISTIPNRYRNLKIIIPHLAGGLAMLLRRLDNQLPLVASLAEPPSITARRMWYDSCCHGSSAAMNAAIEAFGADRIVLGSDYPFLTPHETYGETIGFLARLGLSDSALELVLRGNAEALLRQERRPSAEPACFRAAP
ncbi:amidohydrolase family protein [Sphingobium sp. AN558]|uniref:amidohydrolase family protein n=1 Tax=Sphingobium sp. AN558 TaxID=3133442 RepID=UPI0030C0C953